MKLELSDISKSYGKYKALDNFSTTLTKGVYGLLGPNGAGKTTLISIITGLISADSGRIVYTNSEDNRTLGEVIGFLPQYQNFYKNFTAEEFLMYMSDLKGFPPKKNMEQIEDLLKKVNLFDSKKKKIGTFSGGMKQRLGIAQAMLGDPQIVIFDEPTSGLDPKERIRFRNIISSLGKDKIVILATHIVTDVAYIAKEVILINKGKLLFSAPQSELTNSIYGKVWEYRCCADELIGLMNDHNISNIAAEKTDYMVRIVTDSIPFENAVIAEPNLDDVCLYYFGEIHNEPHHI